MRPGSALHLIHGAHAKAPLRAALAARLGDLDAFRAGLESDQGGADTLSTIRTGYVRRQAELEAVCRLLGADLVERGIFSRKGRTRTTLKAFLAACAAWDRNAQRLGMDRRARDLSEISINEFLQTDETDQTNPERQTRTDSEAQGDGSTFRADE